MRIESYDSGLLHSRMYVIEENGHAIVIDPCRNTVPADNIQTDLLIITHEHYDHISGVKAWKEKTGALLLCSMACAKRIQDSHKNMSRYFDAFCAMQTWVPFEPSGLKTDEYICEAEQTFEDTCSFEWQGHKVVLEEIPGHSPGSIGIFIDKTDFFSGDSLMKDYPIELRFPGGSRKKWEDTGRKRIEGLPEGIMVHPGHFESFVRLSSDRKNGGHGEDVIF